MKRWDLPNNTFLQLELLQEKRYSNVFWMSLFWIILYSLIQATHKYTDVSQFEYYGSCIVCIVMICLLYGDFIYTSYKIKNKFGLGKK